MLPISVKYLCRRSKHRADLSHYLKRFIMESRSLPTFQILGRMYNTAVSIKCMMWKFCHSPTLCRYLKTIIIEKTLSIYSTRIVIRYPGFSIIEISNTSLCVKQEFKKSSTVREKKLHIFAQQVHLKLSSCIRFSKKIQLYKGDG